MITTLKEYFSWYELQTLLNEDRMADAKKAWPIAADIMDEFTDVNPKYLMWIARAIHQDPNFEYSDRDRWISRIKTALDRFNKGITRGVITNKDINFYNDLNELEDAVLDVPDYSNSQLASRVKKDKQIIYADKRFTVFKLDNKEAACLYGRGTRWCISATEDNKFDTYNSEYDIFMAIDKEPRISNQAKIVFIIKKDGSDREVYDSEDNLIHIRNLVGWPKEVLAAVLEKLPQTDFDMMVRNISELDAPAGTTLFDEYLFSIKDHHNARYLSGNIISLVSANILFDYLTSPQRYPSRTPVLLDRVSNILTGLWEVETIVKKLYEQGRLTPENLKRMGFMRSEAETAVDIISRIAEQDPSQPLISKEEF